MRVTSSRRRGRPTERLSVKLLERSSNLRRNRPPSVARSGVWAGAIVALFSSVLTATVSILVVHATLDGNNSMADEEFRRTNRLDAYGRFLDRLDEAEIVRDQAKRSLQGPLPTKARPQETVKALREAAENLRRAGTTVDLLTNAEASLVSKNLIRHHSSQTTMLLKLLCNRLPEDEVLKNECRMGLNEAQSQTATANERLYEAARRTSLRGQWVRDYYETRGKFLDVARADLGLREGQ